MAKRLQLTALLKSIIMSTESVLILLACGAIAGWLAGLVWQGGGLGLIGNIVIGIIGSFVGYWLLPKLGVSMNVQPLWLSWILTSAIGALVLLVLINLIFGSRRS
jgi:uncharacterized membrane protein YeaQ/YmgE (transglycosylase-associated protein family)